MEDHVYSKEYVKKTMGGKKFFFLEDNKKFYDDREKELKTYDVECFHAKTPDQFELLLKKEKVNRTDNNVLFIIDLQLSPKEDVCDWENLGGYKEIKKLRKKNYQNPVVIASNYVEKELPESALDEFSHLGVISSFQKTEKTPQLILVILAAYMSYLNTRKNDTLLKAQVRDDIFRSIFHSLSAPFKNASASLDNLLGKHSDNPELAKDYNNLKITFHRFNQLREAERKLRKKIDKFGLSNFATMDVAKWLPGWVNYIRANSLYPNCTIRLAPLPKGKLAIRGNAELLELILENLVTNAEKAVYNKPDQTITIGIKEDPNFVVLYVEDRGGGFPRTVLGDLFKIPVSNWTGPQSGQGLGLFLTKRLVEGPLKGYLSRRHLEKDDEIIGSCMTVKLPIER